MASHNAETRENEHNLPKISYLDEAKKENPCLPLASLDLLNKYGNRMKQFGRGKPDKRISETTSSTSESRKLSVVGIIKLARMRLLQSKSDNTIDSYLDNLFAFNHPLGVHSTSSHARTDVVEFVLCLLVAAEKFSIQQFDLAKELLSHCDYFASAAGTPVQKIVHYFSKALGQRIDIEKGNIDPERTLLDANEAFMNLHPAIFVSEQAFPIIQVAQFTGIQAILDNMASTKRIHLIDFQIRSGIHCTILMQTLATRNSFPLEQLKTTAVGTSKDGLEIQEGGCHLLQNP